VVRYVRRQNQGQKGQKYGACGGTFAFEPAPVLLLLLVPVAVPAGAHAPPPRVVSDDGPPAGRFDSDLGPPARMTASTLASMRGPSPPAFAPLPMSKSKSPAPANSSSTRCKWHAKG
jgi:hypothetical protein